MYVTRFHCSQNGKKMLVPEGSIVLLSDNPLLDPLDVLRKRTALNKPAGECVLCVCVSMCVRSCVCMCMYRCLLQMHVFAWFSLPVIILYYPLSTGNGSMYEFLVTNRILCANTYDNTAQLVRRTPSTQALCRRAVVEGGEGETYTGQQEQGRASEVTPRRPKPVVSKLGIHIVIVARRQRFPPSFCCGGAAVGVAPIRQNSAFVLSCFLLLT